MGITREAFWSIATWQKVFMYLVMLLSIVFVITIFVKKISLWRQAGGGFGSLQGRDFLGRTCRLIFGQSRILKDRMIGIAHWLIFFGMTVLLLGTIALTIAHYTGRNFLIGDIYLVYSFVLELAGLALLIGVILASVRRYILKPEQVERRAEDGLILACLFLIGLTGFLLEAIRISLTKPAFEVWSFVGYRVAGWLTASGWQPGATAYQIVWMLHVIVVAVFICSIGKTKLMHMFLAGLNYAVKEGRKLGELSWKPDRESDLPAPLKELTWTQLLAADACTRCGRCNKVCPAVQVNSKMEPRNLLAELRGRLKLPPAKQAQDYLEINGQAWSCLTCMACAQTCPVMINTADVAVGLRRQLVELGEVPRNAARMLENVQSYGNAYGPNSQRLAWARKATAGREPGSGPQDVWLVWTGCVSAFDQMAQEGIKSLIDLLDLCSINYILLGKGEKCCGDPVRRIGEEGLFLELAEKNIATFQEYGVTKIVTSCPHCLNVLKNDYRKLGFQGEVVHHSQLLAQIIASNQLKLQPLQGKYAFHDPCYLGRANEIFDAPRAVLKHLVAQSGGELLELPRHKSESFCCGGGGGQLWLDIPGERRPADLRMEEAVQKGVDTLVTGCPFCKLTLSNANMKSEIQIVDLAQLALRSGAEQMTAPVRAI